MSVLNIGINDVSDQERAIKDKLASKDGHITALKTQLSRQSEEMQELRETYNENLRKLASQASRLVELENELKAQSNLLSNEKMASQNADQSLAAARATIKRRELDARELEVKLDQLSHLSDEHKSQADKLHKDKSMLEARVRELQAALPQTVLPPVTPRHRRPARSRSRSSSPSRDRVVVLEREMERLRSTFQQKEADVMAANEKALRAHEAQIRLGNEKVAMERRMQTVIAELKMALEEKEEEMRTQTMNVEGFYQREKELEERIDADEARHQAMIKTLQDDMGGAREEIKKLRKSLAQAENMQMELLSQREAVMEKLEKSRWAMHEIPLKVNPNVTPIDNETASNIERLLAATTRLRGERDALLVERDDLQTRLDFLQAESKFELEALNAKLTLAVAAGSSQSSTDDAVNFDSLNAVHRATLSEKNSEIRRLGLAVTTCGVVVQHLRSEAEALVLCAINACSSRDEALEKLAKIRIEMSELHHRVQQSELNMELNMDFLKENTHEVEELHAELEARDIEFEEILAAVKSAEEGQDFYKKQYDNAESQRSSLALEVTNLNNELSVAQEELKAAENRYTELQSQQFDTMSKTERMRILQNELMEERARVGRRDEHIKMLSNDIGRMETTMVLQEERLSEMTTEFEAMAAAKEAMVDDCADAREARDNALSRLEEMEMAMEARVEEGDRTLEALTEVLIQTIGNARDRLRVEREQVDLAKQGLAQLEEEHRNAFRMAQEVEAAEEARQSTIALAVSQVELGKALGRIQNLMAENDQLQREVVAQQDYMDHDSQDNEVLAQQLKALEAQAAAAMLSYSEQTDELQRRIQDLEQAISDNQAKHDAAIAELVQSKDQLSATLQETRQSLAENNSNEEITRLQEQYAVQLAEARTQLSGSEKAREELHASHAMTKDQLQKALEDVKSLREQVDLGVAQGLQQAATYKDATTQKEEEISRLRADIASAQSKKEVAEAALEELKSCFDRLTTELDSLKAQHQESLTQSAEAHVSIQRGLEGKLADLQTKLDERSRELDDAVQEKLEVNHKLEHEVASRSVDKENHRKELDDALSQRKDVESALAQLKEEIESTRVKFQQSTKQVDLLQEEKLSLQEEITALGAEVQKSISLKRYLESQVKESEDKITSYVGELEQVRADLARVEKAANAAEVNLSLQGAQHKRETSELNRQLTALRAQPNLQSALAELEERNDEMEELLKKKCIEIEENDDRALEMLKENKKLTTKVESLTRKVQTLQTKLAAAKASIPAAPETPEAPEALTEITPQPSVQPLNTVSRTIGDRPRSVTLSSTDSPSMSAAPPVKAFLSSAPLHPPSSASRTPLNRTVSGPLPHSKTPERKVLQHTPVFKAKTPERKTVLSPPAELRSSSSIGKKRRAPDDFETCESLPPQGFTAECEPSQELSENPTTTPRPRRIPSGPQSSFTPKRNPRPMASMPSPKRLVATKSGERPPPVIADVTNSPRGQSSKTKRSWLGKIRGASSQATSRPADSRPRL